MTRDPGVLQHRVQIQENLNTVDSFGEQVDGEDGWRTIAYRYAEILPLAGREYWDAQQVKSDVTHTITFRLFDGLTSAHRLKFGSRVFNLASVVNEGEDDTWHVCRAIEVL